MKRDVFGIKGLTDDDNNGEHFHYDSYDGGMFNWTAKTSKEYSAIENRINRIGKEHKAFSVYAWCDVSGFDYWVRKQEEPNYIQISVILKKKSLTARDIIALKRAIEGAEVDASNIQYDCEDDVADLLNRSRGAS